MYLLGVFNRRSGSHKWPWHSVLANKSNFAKYLFSKILDYIYTCQNVLQYFGKSWTIELSVGCKHSGKSGKSVQRSVLKLIAINVYQHFSANTCPEKFNPRIKLCRLIRLATRFLKLCKEKYILINIGQWSWNHLKLTNVLRASILADSKSDSSFSCRSGRQYSANWGLLARHWRKPLHSCSLVTP